MGDKDWGSGDPVAADWPCKQTIELVGIFISSGWGTSISDY